MSADAGAPSTILVATSGTTLLARIDASSMSSSSVALAASGPAMTWLSPEAVTISRRDPDSRAWSAAHSKARRAPSEPSTPTTIRCAWPESAVLTAGSLALAASPLTAGPGPPSASSTPTTLRSLGPPDQAGRADGPDTRIQGPKGRGEPLRLPDVRFSRLSRTGHGSGGGSVQHPSGLPLSIANPPPSTAQSPTLRANELNLFDSTVVAVSSVAPAYSLAATLALLFAAVAYAGPAVIIVSFIPVLFIAVAYFYLNRRDPNCGACFAWLSKLVNPSVGWFNGWVQVAASVLFCVAAPLLAGSYTLQFMHSVGWISSTTADSAWLTALLGVLWLGFITFITIYGIRWTANAQWVFLLIQYVALLGISI